MSKAQNQPEPGVEVRKRQVKELEAGALIHKGIDLGDRLDLIPSTITEKLAGTLGATPTHRDLLSAAIASHLPTIVRCLTRLGFEPHLVQRQRPRVFDPAAWDALERAEAIVDLPKTVLLRACLVLLAREGVGRISLRECMDELAQLEAKNRDSPQGQ